MLYEVITNLIRVGDDARGLHDVGEAHVEQFVARVLVTAGRVNAALDQRQHRGVVAAGEQRLDVGLGIQPGLAQQRGRVVMPSYNFV